jgi:hypothetical protein
MYPALDTMTQRTMTTNHLWVVKLPPDQEMMGVMHKRS